MQTAYLMPKTFRKFRFFRGSMPPDPFFIKPSSHMLPKYLWHSHRYCLQYYCDIWGHNATSNKKDRRCLPPACLQSWTRVNFAGMMAVNTDMASVAGNFCSHIGTVSQASGSTGSYVAGSSAAYENQALRTKRQFYPTTMRKKHKSIPNWMFH